MSKSDEYFAGLFDGEGCVTMSLSKKGCITLSVLVSMCSREPVRLLHERFGGRFYDGSQRTKMGTPIYRWEVNNVGSVEALSVFSKNCIGKADICSLGLMVAESMAKNTRKQPLSKEDKAMRIDCLRKIAAANRLASSRVISSDRVEKFLSDKSFGGKAVSLSDGRTFDSMSAAARELGVTAGAIWHAVNSGGSISGLKVVRQ